MFIKVRRDTLIILILAFILIVSGRAMTYVGFASSDSVDDGVPIAGIMVKGNDIVPLSTIKANVEAAGFRDGSYIKGNTLITSQRQLLLSDAIQNAQELVKKSTIPGTAISPINVAEVQVDVNTGNVVVNVVEDFSVMKVNKKLSSNSSNSTSTSTKTATSKKSNSGDIDSGNSESGG